MKILYALSLLFLVSCSKKADEKTVNYSCDNKMKISAKYFHEQPDMELSIDGKTLQLHQSISASGSKYKTEHGLKPETGLVWWVKGDNALMYEVVGGIENDSAIAKCTASE